MSLCQIIPNTRTICYDLSYPLNDETIFWPGGETFSHCVNTCRVSCEMNLMNNDNNNSDYFYSAGVINCPEHGGTHVDAPYHFAEDGITVDLLPLENLIATCRVIDISHKLDSLHSEYSLVAEDILNHENQYGELEPQSIVLIRTGWNKFYSQGAKQYLGFDEKTQGPYDSSSSKLRFPGISSDAAYLFIERKICGVGLDTASLDPGSCTEFLAHRILLGSGIYGIENINQNIDQIPITGSSLFVMPMKLTGGTGAPARIVACVPIK